MAVENMNDLEQLQIALEEFSMEAGFISSVGNYLARKGSNLSLSIRKGFKYMFTWDFPMMEDLNPNSMQFFLNRGIDYSEQSKLPVPKPFGLKVEMLDYTTVLLGRAVVLNEIVDHVVDGTTNMVSSYINDPTLRSEKRFSNLNRISVDLEQLKKDESKYFNNTRQADGQFGQIYNSFQDFIKSEQNIQQLRLMIDDGRLDKIQVKVDNLARMAEGLIEGLGRNVEDPKAKPSREFTKHLSDELMYCAKWIEYYGLQLTRIIETNNVLKGTEDILRKL